MRIRKAKELKKINICLCAIFCLLLIACVCSAFFDEKWDFILLALFIFVLLLYTLINTEWEVSCAGVACYILFGKVKVKSYPWSSFCYIGSLLVLGKGRPLTREMIVCAEDKPYREYSNSSAYTLRGRYLAFENTEENRRIFASYFIGNI